MGKWLPTDSKLFASGVFFFFFGLICLIPSVIQFMQIQSYHAGRCTIIGKQLLNQTRTTPSVPGGGLTEEIPITIPNFQFLVYVADGSHYRAQGYDLDSTGGDITNGRWDQGNGQVIFDMYTVGETYPCWYDPANPKQAVLTRHIEPLLFGQALFAVLGGGLCALIAMLRLKWRQFTRARQSSPLR